MSVEDYTRLKGDSQIIDVNDEVEVLLPKRVSAPRSAKRVVEEASLPVSEERIAKKPNPKRKQKTWKIGDRVEVYESENRPNRMLAGS